MNQRNGKFIERLLANILDFQIIIAVILIPSLLPRMLTGQSILGMSMFFYYVSVFLLSAPLGALYSTIFISKFEGFLQIHPWLYFLRTDIWLRFLENHKK